MPTVHERELFTDTHPYMRTRTHTHTRANVKATVMVGRVADFSESTASKIHKRPRLRRGNVDTLLADDYHIPFLDDREILFRRIFSDFSRAPLLLLAPLARNTIVLLYDLRRGLGKLPTYFFSPPPPLSSLLSSPSFPRFVYHRFTAVELRAAWWNFDRFPIAGLDKQTRFFGRSLVVDLYYTRAGIRSSPLE